MTFPSLPPSVYNFAAGAAALAATAFRSAASAASAYPYAAAGVVVAGSSPFFAKHIKNGFSAAATKVTNAASAATSFAGRVVTSGKSGISALTTGIVEKFKSAAGAVRSFMEKLVPSCMRPAKGGADEPLRRNDVLGGEGDVSSDDDNSDDEGGARRRVILTNAATAATTIPMSPVQELDDNA